MSIANWDQRGCKGSWRIFSYFSFLLLAGADGQSRWGTTRFAIGWVRRAILSLRVCDSGLVLAFLLSQIALQMRGEATPISNRDQQVKNETVIKCSILKGHEQLFATRYQLYLPSEEELIATLILAYQNDHAITFCHPTYRRMDGAAVYVEEE